MWVVYLAAALIAFDAVVEIWLNVSATDEKRRKMFEALKQAHEDREHDRNKLIYHSTDAVVLGCYVLIAIGLHSLLGYIMGAVLVAYFLRYNFGVPDPGEYEFRLKWAIQNTIHGALELGYALLFVLTYALR